MYGILLKSLLGPVYEQLAKSIVKQSTASVVDITELHDAFQLVPKSVVAWLMVHAAPMKEGESKEVKAPWNENTFILLNKKAQDVYSGYFIKDGQKAHEFELCSIPQLAAHILSFFELYDEAVLEHQQEKGASADSKVEVQSKEPAGQATPVVVVNAPAANTASEEVADIKARLANLENKINALVMACVLTLHKSEGNSAQVKQIQKSRAVVRLLKTLKSLAKANDLKMPAPPRPGSKVGGDRGITHAGHHGFKTAFSDFNPAGGQTQTRLNPYLKSGPRLAAQSNLPKQPSTPKQPKVSLAFKSELDVYRCPDCGQTMFEKGTYKRCGCFLALSEPYVEKKNGHISLTLPIDWSDDDKKALIDSWARKKRGRHV